MADDHVKKVFKDDDEDLIMQLNEIEKASKPKEVVSPRLRKAIENIMKQISSLKYGDLSKRVDSLVALNEII